MVKWSAEEYFWSEINNEEPQNNGENVQNMWKSIPTNVLALNHLADKDLDFLIVDGHHKRYYLLNDAGDDILSKIIVRLLCFGAPKRRWVIFFDRCFIKLEHFKMKLTKTILFFPVSCQKGLHTSKKLLKNDFPEINQSIGTTDSVVGDKIIN